VVGNRAVDVNKINALVRQNFVLAGVAFFNAELVTAFL